MDWTTTSVVVWKHPSSLPAPTDNSVEGLDSAVVVCLFRPPTFRHQNSEVALADRHETIFRKIDSGWKEVLESLGNRNALLAWLQCMIFCACGKKPVFVPLSNAQFFILVLFSQTLGSIVNNNNYYSYHYTSTRQCSERTRGNQSRQWWPCLCRDRFPRTGEC